MTQKGLVILVADKNMEHALRGLLKRQHALKIRPVGADIFAHPEHDPGCYLRAHTFLRSMTQKYHHALVLFDHDGCGAEQRTREELEAEVEERMACAGWEGRSKAIVLNPELEIWVWSRSSNVPDILGWEKSFDLMREWLISQVLWESGAGKPHAPKEAMEAVLRRARLPRSASQYQQLAETVSMERCSDAAFQKLKQTLQLWFSSDTTTSPNTGTVFDL